MYCLPKELSSKSKSVHNMEDTELHRNSLNKISDRRYVNVDAFCDFFNNLNRETVKANGTEYQNMTVGLTLNEYLRVEDIDRYIN